MYDLWNPQHINFFFNDKGTKGKAIPLQAWTSPEGSRRLKDPRFHDNRRMKGVRLSALRTGRLYPQRNVPGTHVC
jgi:hypothetical protein